MSENIRRDFENLNDGARITIFPLQNNPIQREPQDATYAAGYFYLDGSPHTEGPDYYFGDILKYCDGFEEISQ